MVGRIFMGRYESVKLLGEGGMGRVYLARQLDLPRQVVVKVMHEHVASDPKFRERFQRETLLMARFQHPYAVALYDATLNDPEGPCIVMEYIRGVSLDTLLARNGRLSPPRVGRLLGQLCEVLQAAHDVGMVHRDLKPANLMVVDPDTPYEKVKVMDFGLAKLLDNANVNKITDTNIEFAVGTPGYICPEQIRGEKMDHRGDIYSVGVILYELLAGKLPFEGKSSLDILLAHATMEPPKFSHGEGGQWVPPAVEAVVMACLAKNPNDRPTTARELMSRYDQALNHQAEEPEKAAEEPVAPAAAAVVDEPVDPNTVVHKIEAWMPEQIAAYKLQGFVQDVGGEVMQSVPGRIKVRLGGKGSVYTPLQSGPLSWFGLGRRTGQVEMELNLSSGNERDNHMLITVVMRPCRGQPADDMFRARCAQIYIDLRGYLMGKAGPIGGE